MKTLFNKFFFILLLLIVVFSCKPKEEIFTSDASIVLQFSENSLSFDSIITEVQTPTQRLKVFNPSRNALRISRINLQDATSPFKIILNGEQASSFDNIVLLGQDSLLLLISLQVASNNIDTLFSVKDNLIFDFNGKQQQVELSATVENIEVVRGALSCDQLWTSKRPYLLIDSVIIPENCQLTIGPGTKIYAFNNSKITVLGSLEVQGLADSLVSFQYYRREPFFNNILGLWKGIEFTPNSKNNRLSSCRIKNAQNGIKIQESDLKLNGCIIQHHSKIGVSAFNASISLENTLINNCIEGLLVTNGEGEYSLIHCTLANYSFNFSRQAKASVVFSPIQNLLSVAITNSIIWGDLSEEIIIDSEPSTSFIVETSILKTKNENLIRNQNLVNITADSLFVNPRINDFRLPSISPAIDQGIITFVTQDILGKPRSEKPDIGAYERQP